MTFKDMSIVLIDTEDKHCHFHIKRYCVESGIKLITFDDSTEAMKYVLENDIDMIIIKNKMAHLKGVDFIQEFRKTYTEIPVIMFIEEDDKETLYQEALKVGVNDFLCKPFNEIESNLRIENLLKIRQKDMLLNDKAKLLKDEVSKATKELNKREFEALAILSKTVEYKDHNTNIHVARISHYSKILAAGYGLSERVQSVIFHASAFHDIGKVGIPDKILLIPRQLKDDEFEIMKQHTLIGYSILKNAKDKFLSIGRVIAFTHHEKYDGTGYPKGLKGHKIPLEGRIVAVADVFDALTSERPYKEAWDFDKAVSYIKEQSGKHFDPDIVNIFIKNIKKIKEVFETYK
ncbi:MAG: response regulator [Thiovulaceae bacterium]|nr:response regulator [Sulfurimonadaceae bacterium]